MSSWFSGSCQTSSTSPPVSNANCAMSFDYRQKRQAEMTTQTIDTPICMGMGDVAVAMILVILIFTTVIGNILVVLSIAVYRRMRTFTNVLLVSLATADLLVGIMVMPIALVDQLHRHRWQFGLILCKLWTTIDVLLCTASILNLCVISLDRYFAITAPLRYTRTRSQTLAAAIVAAVWLVSLVISSPPWFVPQWRIQLEDQQCGYAKATAYRIYSAFGSFYIPLLIMLFVYFKIFRVASTREKVLNAERRGSRTMQMWQQQANRRAARNSLAANATLGAQLSLSRGGQASTASSRSAAGSRTGPRHYDVMQPVDEHSDDDDVIGKDGRQNRSIANDPRRKITSGSTNSYYRHMNRCESPATQLKQVKFVGVAGGGDIRQQYPDEQKTKRLRFQRTPTEELLDVVMTGPASSSWRPSITHTDQLNTTIACSSLTDMSTHGRPTTTLGGHSRASIDCGTVQQLDSIGGAVTRKITTSSIPGSTGSQNNIPLLSDHARRYFERTVPWSLVRKANEYYINSKPLRPSREKLIYLKERKALKTIGIVVSGFIICWLPFFIMYLVEAAFFASAQHPVPFTSTVPAHPTTRSVPISNVTQKSRSLNTSTTIGRYRGYKNAFIVTLTAAVAADFAAMDDHLGSGPTSLSTPYPAMGDREALIASSASPSVFLLDSQANQENNTSSTLDFIGYIPPILADLFLWLGYSNSVLNPLIYTFYNRDFRRCFKDLLSMGCLRRNAANRRMSVRRLHQTRL